MILTYYSRRVSGLNGSRRLKRWWLCFDVIENLLDDVWISDVSDNPHGTTTQVAQGGGQVMTELSKVAIRFYRSPSIQAWSLPS